MTLFYSLKIILNKYIINYITGGARVSCIFQFLLGSWFSFCIGTCAGQAPSSWKVGPSEYYWAEICSLLPSAHLPGGSLVSLRLFFSDCELQSRPLCHLHRSDWQKPRPGSQGCPDSPCGGRAFVLAVRGTRDAPLPAGLSSSSTEWGAPFHASPTHPHLQYSQALCGERITFSWTPSECGLEWRSRGWPWDVCEEWMRRRACWNPQYPVSPAAAHRCPVPCVLSCPVVCDAWWPRGL